MIGMVTLPEVYNPIITDGWYNLNGWWNPPPFVTSFWSTACYINYDDSSDYLLKVEIIRSSYISAVNQYWSMIVLQDN